MTHPGKLAAQLKWPLLSYFSMAHAPHAISVVTAEKIALSRPHTVQYSALS